LQQTEDLDRARGSLEQPLAGIANQGEVTVTTENKPQSQLVCPAEWFEALEEFHSGGEEQMGPAQGYESSSMSEESEEIPDGCTRAGVLEIPVEELNAKTIILRERLIRNNARRLEKKRRGELTKEEHAKERKKRASERARRNQYIAASESTRSQYKKHLQRNRGIQGR
jgi:hypothetical protein